MKQILFVAQKEFQDGIRNRWLISITLLFALLAIGISYAGGVASGTIGFSSLSTTIASLASLAVLLIPLIALLLCFDSFVAEQEAGTLLLLLTYPLSKSQLLLGKFIGQGAIISLAIIVGFGAAALLLYSNINDPQILSSFAIFILSAIALGLCFIAIAYVISLLVSEKSKAAGAALLTWFFFALAFDLLILALLVGVDHGFTQQGLTQLMMLNPADIFRLVNIAGLDTSDVNGALAIAIQSSLSQGQLIALLVTWIIVPLSIANLLFRKKTL